MLSGRPVLLRVLAVSLAVLAGSLLGSWIAKPRPLDLNDSHNWLLIRDDWGVLDPREGPVTARVSVISRFSGEAGWQTVQDNKIEVQRGGSSTVFVWPTQNSFAAGRCEILDVDGDGAKEFVLFSGTEPQDTEAVRIVAYSAGTFQFEGHRDQLVTLGFPIGPLDLGNQRLVFITDEHFPKRLESKFIRIPHVMRWSRQQGFEDVSAQYPSYYTDQFLPQILEKLRTEKDVQMQKLYSDAITYIETRLSPRSSTSGLRIRTGLGTPGVK